MLCSRPYDPGSDYQFFSVPSYHAHHCLRLLVLSPGYRLISNCAYLTKYCLELRRPSRAKRPESLAKVTKARTKELRGIGKHRFERRHRLTTMFRLVENAVDAPGSVLMASALGNNQHRAMARDL